MKGCFPRFQNAHISVDMAPENGTPHPNIDYPPKKIETPSQPCWASLSRRSGFGQSKGFLRPCGRMRQNYLAFFLATFFLATFFATFLTAFFATFFAAFFLATFASS